VKILISGATGFIGRGLFASLAKERHELVLLTRSGGKTSALFPGARLIPWNPDATNDVIREADGCDAIVNLAGEPVIGKRWSRKQKMRILESRVHSTKIITQSIAQAAQKPKVFISASAVGYYGSRASEELTEEARSGSDFLADVCKAWEAHAVRAEDFGVRVVRLRIGIVLAKEGGALQKMLPPFRLFLGGWLGDGNQWMSWIHRDDLVRLICFCLDRTEARGIVNAVAPQPVTNKAFSMVLAQTLQRPCLAPVPAFVLKLLLGEMSTMLLGSQRAIPKRARELGFVFNYPEIRGALKGILS
jgi:uncharacterized protein (TIGR01777 family)